MALKEMPQWLSRWNALLVVYEFAATGNGHEVFPLEAVKGSGNPEETTEKKISDYNKAF